MTEKDRVAGVPGAVAVHNDNSGSGFDVLTKVGAGGGAVAVVASVYAIYQVNRIGEVLAKIDARLLSLETKMNELTRGKGDLEASSRKTKKTLSTLVKDLSHCRNDVDTVVSTLVANYDEDQNKEARVSLIGALSPSSIVIRKKGGGPKTKQKKNDDSDKDEDSSDDE